MLCLLGSGDNRNVDVFMISSATVWVRRCAVRTVDLDLCAHTARGEVQWFTPPLLDDTEKDATLAHTIVFAMSRQMSNTRTKLASVATLADISWRRYLTPLPAVGSKKTESALSRREGDTRQASQTLSNTEGSRQVSLLAQRTGSPKRSVPGVYMLTPDCGGSCASALRLDEAQSYHVMTCPSKSGERRREVGRLVFVVVGGLKWKRRVSTLWRSSGQQCGSVCCSCYGCLSAFDVCGLVCGLC